MKVVIPWADFVTMARTEIYKTMPLATGDIEFVITSNTEPDRSIAETPNEVHIAIDDPCL